MPVVVVCQSYVKEYTYNASDNESKIEARQIALKEVKRLLIEELGVYTHTTTTLQAKNGISTIDIETQVKVISECITKTEILEEKWDGEFYYIKVKLTVNEKDLRNRLKQIERAEEQRRKLTNPSDPETEKIAHKNKINFSEEVMYGSLFGCYHPNTNPSFGLSFGVIMGHKVSLGLFAETNLDFLFSPDDNYTYRNKGLLFELLFFNESAVNLTFPIKLGSGYFSYTKDKNKVGSDSFFVAEPSLEIGISIGDYIKITTNFGYRITGNVVIQDVPSGMVNGFVAGLSVKMMAGGF